MLLPVQVSAGQEEFIVKGVKVLLNEKCSTFIYSKYHKGLSGIIRMKAISVVANNQNCGGRGTIYRI